MCGWGMRDSRSGTETWSSCCLRKTWVWTSHSESVKQIMSVEFLEHDAFVDVQHFSWVARVVGNSQHSEIAEFGEEKTVKLIFNIALIAYRRISPVGLLKDVDAGRVGCMRDFQDLIRSDTTCVVSRSAGHFWKKSPKRFESRSLKRLCGTTVLSWS